MSFATIRSVGCAAVLACALVCVGRSARADGPAATPDTAREHFEHGVALYDQHQYDAALTEFEASFAQRPVASVMFNIAQAERELGRYPDAIESFERYLALASDAVTDAERASVEATITELRTHVGVLELHAEPATVAVGIDGHVVDLARASHLALAEGEHAVDLQAEGYRPLHVTLDIRGGETLVVNRVLEPIVRDAVLQVAANVSRANVSIDGVAVGTGEVTRTVNPGTHRIEARAEGYLPATVTVTIAAGERRPVRVTLAQPSILTRWPLWAGVGAGAAVVAIVIVAIVLSAPSGPAPIPGNGDPSVIHALPPL